jgi:competence protein ComEC
VARFAGSAAGQIKEWSLADVGPGFLVPWLPIAFGLGIVIYFAAEREPAWWAGLCLGVASAAVAIILRARPVAVMALVLTMTAAGFATATLRGLRVAHAVLPYPAFSVEISGFVEMREERERSDRIVIHVQRMEGQRLSVKPERVRLSVRKGTAPPVGSFVALKARLNPPLQPLRPGGYDFARDVYFQGIGASGFVLGPIRRAEAPVPPGFLPS